MATSNGWDSYIWQMQNAYSAKKGTYLKMNVCKHAAILGIDGTVWACTADWPGLKEYDMEIEDETGNKKTVKVNEV